MNQTYSSFRKGLPFLGLAILIAIFFQKMAFSDLILARGDTYLYFYPYWHAAQDALLNGRLPLWNPDIFMGAPLLANSQMGFFYPPNWLVWALFDVPTAVKATIIIHLLLTSAGVYQLSKNGLRYTSSASFLAAVLFTLGGYLTAQVEHVNQLQGLTYLPWVLLYATPSYPKTYTQKGCWIALFFTLQLCAGHTQTTFITGIATIIWYTMQSFSGTKRPWQHTTFWYGWLSLGTAVISALFLAAAQLIPTAELTQLSSRQGGLTINEVLSFSWNPLLATSSLLPSYETAVFSEYVAFVPITAICLAIYGFFYSQKKPWGIIALLLVGLFLALGRFNGLYYILGRLPGFDLFRVPARWLVLYSLGISLLAAHGWQLLQAKSSHQPLSLGGIATYARSHFILAIPPVLVLAILAWGYVAVYLGRWIPVGAESPLTVPTTTTLIAILAELALATFALHYLSHKAPAQSIVPSILLFSLMLTSLFTASRAHPYNNLTTAEAYHDQRPPSLRLAAETQEQIAPSRFLSLSNIFFDPGDQTEINTIYGDLLTTQAQYDYTIAIKMKEIIAPNLSMIYQQPSLDGFDGGILPLQNYSQLMSQSILDGRVTTDGRLREQLESIPQAEWLDIFQVGYIITDKVGDAWEDGVYFDRQHPLTLAPETSGSVGYLLPFTADGLRLLAAGQGEIHVTTKSGEQHQLLPEETADGRWLAQLPQATEITALHFIATDQPWEISAVTLINQAENHFIPLTLGNYRLIHSGDVKIYENLDVWPRATLHSPTASTISSTRLPDGSARITQYTPEQIIIQTTTTEPAQLILTDAVYPGWQASIDGQPAEIHTVDGFFRAVQLPAGAQEVIFEYRPSNVYLGITISLVSLVLWLTLTIMSRTRKQPIRKNTT